MIDCNLQFAIIHLGNENVGLWKPKEPGKTARSSIELDCRRERASAESIHMLRGDSLFLFPRLP